MSIGIQDLPDELVVRITNVLARRPEYGIAIPSRRWLQRQEEKISDLPKELLRSSNLLKRLATKIADSIDPNIVDPRAILCKTHSALNPFLIRRLFIALAYEVTVHTDALRSWPDRTSVPELSAFVGRLDSIAALWIEPQLFHEIYGLAPFDGHHIFVKSSCEACCLAAVGASGRALVDLRAALLDRMERRRAKPAGQEPRLYRVVEAWIDHFRKHHEGIGRPEECRALSEALLDELRIARPQIQAWRAEQKRTHAILRSAKHSVYTELRRTKSGAKIARLPASAGRSRRTRDGIPVALADMGNAAGQRRSAMHVNRAESIYRPDSLSGFSEVHERQWAAYELPVDDISRPLAPEPTRENTTNDGSPTQSFLRQFEQEMPTTNEPRRYDFEEEYGDDERDFEEEEQSRVRVQEWWASVLCESRLDLGQDDANSVVSMVHPAFRPAASIVAEPVLPRPVRADREPPTNVSGDHGDTVSVWTDCTIPTGGSSSIQPIPEDPPPGPSIIPSTHDPRRASNGDGNRTPRAPSRPPISRGRTTGTGSRHHTTHPTVEGGPRGAASSSGEGRNAPLNWPAPPLGRYYPPTARLNRGPNRRIFSPTLDDGSTFSAQRHQFLQGRFKPREGDERSSATRNHTHDNQRSSRSQVSGNDRTSRRGHHDHHRGSTPAPGPSTQRTTLPPRPSSSVYDGRSIASVSSVVFNRHGTGARLRTSSTGSPHNRYSVSSLSSGRWSSVEDGENETSPTPTRANPRPATVGNRSEGRVGLGRRRASDRDARSSVTQLGAFRGRM